MTPSTLTPELLRKINAYWRAANYVSVGQIYLYDNPLLRRPLQLSGVKPLVVSHWGTTPGQNFIYVHLNRVINKYDLDMSTGSQRLHAPGPRFPRPRHQQKSRYRQGRRAADFAVR